MSTLSRFILEADRLLEVSHQTEDRHIYEMLIARAGVILAKIKQDGSVQEDIETMEHFFGNTWLKDDKAYSKVYSTWEEFKCLLVNTASKKVIDEQRKEKN